MAGSWGRLFGGLPTLEVGSAREDRRNRGSPPFDAARWPRIGRGLVAEQLSEVLPHASALPVRQRGPSELGHEVGGFLVVQRGIEQHVCQLTERHEWRSRHGDDHAGGPRHHAWRESRERE